MATMVCVPCRVFFRIERTGVAVEEGFGDGQARPYKLWMADRYECPSCHTQVIAGFGMHPIAEHYFPDYVDMRAKIVALKETIFVDDCPGFLHVNVKARP